VDLLQEGPLLCLEVFGVGVLLVLFDKDIAARSRPGGRSQRYVEGSSGGRSGNLIDGRTCQWHNRPYFVVREMG
jgi:hypothetical protein